VLLRNPEIVALLDNWIGRQSEEGGLYLIGLDFGDDDGLAEIFFELVLPFGEADSLHLPPNDLNWDSDIFLSWRLGA